MVIMKDDIDHEVEETVITNFLQLAVGDDGCHQPEDTNPIDCNNIRIGTFTTKNEEPLALCADIGALKSVVDKNRMNRILDKLDRKSIPAIRSNRVFRLGDVSTKSQAMIELGIKTQDYIPPIIILLDTVNVGIPILMDLDDLDGHCLMVDNKTNCL